MKNIKWLVLSAILAGLLTGCPWAVSKTDYALNRQGDVARFFDSITDYPPEWETPCKEVADKCFDFLESRKAMAAVGYSGNKGHVQVYYDVRGNKELRLFCYIDDGIISLSPKHPFTEPYKTFTREEFDKIRDDHMGWIMREE